MNPLSIVDKFKAYGFMALALCLGLIAAGQSVRLHLTQLQVASYKVQLAQKDTAHAEERSAASAERAALEASHRATETTLEAAAAQQRKETHDQVQSVAAQRDALLGRLRDANTRADPVLPGPAADAGAGQAAAGGDPGQLPATLGAADVDEAARAETIRIHLLACYSDYDRAAQALKTSK